MKNTTLGALKKGKKPARYRSIKDELRHNLIRKLTAGEVLFPGIVGYEDSVVPGIVNSSPPAIVSICEALPLPTLGLSFHVKE